MFVFAFLFILILCLYFIVNEMRKSFVERKFSHIINHAEEKKWQKSCSGDYFMLTTRGEKVKR